MTGAHKCHPEAAALRQPTATPWELMEATEHHGAYIVSAWGRTICDLYAMSNPLAASIRNGGDSYPVHFDDMEANAAFIVEAVNSHAALKSRVEEQDRLLAEAADFLNRASRLDAMDLGAVITAYRLKQQRSVAMPLESRGDAT